MKGGARRWQRRYGVLLLIGVVVLTGWWLREADRPNLITKIDHGLEADYTLREFTAIRLTAEGLPLRTIAGTEMVNFGESGLTTIEGLDLVDRQRHWTAAAREAVFVESRDYLRLEDDVRFVSHPAGRPPLRVFCRDLDILLDEGVAQTDKAVRIEQDRVVTTARGMRLLLDRHRLYLLDDVESQYTPRGS